MLLKLRNVILTLLWIIVHFIYHMVTHTVQEVKWHLRHLFSKLITCLPSCSPHGQLTRVVDTMKKLQKDEIKTPKHIGFVLGKEPLRPLEAMWRNTKRLFWPASSAHHFTNDDNVIDLQKLARFVSWAWIADIPVISLYDSKGFIKSNYKDFMGYLHEEFSQNLCVLNDHKQTPKIKLYNLSNVKRKNGYKNGHSEEHMNGTNGTSHREVLHLSFFSKEDGKEAIVQSCKDLHKERKLLDNNSSKSLHHDINQISESLVDKQVKAVVNSEFSIDDESERGLKTDPDLLIVFGKVMSTAGFLPWHIRLTEIHWLQSTGRITLTDFMKSILKFANCQQRFGT